MKSFKNFLQEQDLAESAGINLKSIVSEVINKFFIGSRSFKILGYPEIGTTINLDAKTQHEFHADLEKKISQAIKDVIMQYSK